MTGCPNSCSMLFKFSPGNPASVCPAPVVASWSGAPDIHFEGLALECSGEEGDDEDNIAYRKLVVRSPLSFLSLHLSLSLSLSRIHKHLHFVIDKLCQASKHSLCPYTSHTNSPKVPSLHQHASLCYIPPTSGLGGVLESTSCPNISSLTGNALISN